MERELILIIDFGGQYNQLIARRVREKHVYCEVHPCTISIDKIRELNPKGIIFTGGPASIYEENAPKCDSEVFTLGLPILGICYGMQFMSHTLGGSVRRALKREYGQMEATLDVNSKLFSSLNEKNVCLMSHTDYVDELPEGFKSIALTDTCKIAAMENVDKNFYAVQFHPEVNHTIDGDKIIGNFVLNICKCKGDWKMDTFASSTIEKIKEKVGDGKAVCALSGGVDSSVAAVLMSKAIGNNLTCIFVDHGLLRKNEVEEVEAIFTKQFDVNFIKVDARDRFLTKLAGVTNPEQKRKIIGEEFIRVFFIQM